MNKQEIIFKMDLLRRYLENFDPEFFCKAVNHEAFVEGLKEAGEMLQAGKWIPVSERMPEYTGTFIVWVGINQCGEGMHKECRTAMFYLPAQRFYVHHEAKSELIGSVDKWMPLPEPPKEDQP